MRFLFFLFRAIVGLTFIVSGFFKMMDPVGTGLIIDEYLRAAHLSFFSFLSVPGGIILSLAELLTGIAILLKIRMKIASYFGLCMTLFYTILTLILAIFNPISDCGCFGEAIHLSNWQTFYKNIVLLICIVPIFLYRNKFEKVAPAIAEWIFLSIYGVMSLGVSIYSLMRMPFIEFNNFKVGNNLIVKIDDASQNVQYNTIFTYEKNGKEREFTLKSLPDSTWNYVDSKSVPVGGFGKVMPFDFSVTTIEGEYITDRILKAEKPLFLSIILDMKKFDKKDGWKYLRTLADSVSSAGGDFMILSSTIPTESSFEYGISDYKTLITIQRSNGGIVYINDATIVKKWPKGGLKVKNVPSIIEQDYELITAKESISQQLIYEVSLAIILLTIVLMRYICGIVYGSKRKIEPTE